jgi:hypothetical protein
MAWFIILAPNNASKFSLAALTLPGRVMMRVFPMVPATGLESAARVVYLIDNVSIRCTSPEASRSSIGLIA